MLNEPKKLPHKHIHAPGAHAGCCRDRIAPYEVTFLTGTMGSLRQESQAKLPVQYYDSSPRDFLSTEFLGVVSIIGLLVAAAILPFVVRNSQSYSNKRRKT